jgi:formyltetrahydrofolate deformylase
MSPRAHVRCVVLKNVRVPEHILTLTCPDRSGIIHAVTAGLLDCGANILEQAQFTDPDLGLFCLRTRFEASAPEVESVRATVAARLEGFQPTLAVRLAAHQRRALIMVSKFDHCLVDLLYRHDLGELPIDIPLIVSNHVDCREIAERHAIPFVHVPVTRDSKQEAERELLGLIEVHDIDVVILARYMQVLSDDLCTRLPGRIINIHHSFLPGFKGARPYHQAHERGVKIIGATAHFVTADLDEGPIIEQDVQRVTHADTADELVSIGRDVERRVLSRAVRLYAEDRVFLVGQRTVVFA